MPSICYWCGWLDHDDRDCDLQIQSNGSPKMDQQQFSSFLRAPLYKSSGRDVIYMRGYYEEKSSKAREKKVEMAAHMAARVASAAPPPGLTVPKRETEEIERSISFSLMELNATIIKGEVYVEEGFQLGDSFNPRFKEDLMSPHNFSLASESSPDKVMLSEVNGNLVITEIKAGESQFNANSIPSSSNQRLALINEKTLATSPQGVVLHRLDN